MVQFACLKVAEGDVIGMPSKTRNRHDLIRFLDRLATRRTKEVGEWLEEHPRWRFQFTPTHASWLNQVEISRSSRPTTRPPSRSSGLTREGAGGMNQRIKRKRH